MWITARLHRLLLELAYDTAYAVRSFARTPVFTIAAVLTLSLGIGATTAIYSVTDTVLLQPLPFPEADRLVRIVEPERPRTMPAVTYDEYLQWRSRTTLLDGLAAATVNPQVMVRTAAGTVRLTGGLVSANYFDVLGAQALLGRMLNASDEANPDVVVLSIRTWRRHFGADPAVLRTAIEFRSGNLARRFFTIVGVMPEDMETVSASMDFYRPIVPAPGARFGLGPLIGRLRRGVPLAAASAEANVIGEAIRAPRPDGAPPLTRPRFEAQPLKDDLVAALRPALRVFLSAVVVVLLIVCANVASLLLARGTARRREIAVRLAIGG